MQTITGIEAAQMEQDGRGTFSIKGKTVTFTGTDGRSAIWETANGRMAEVQLRFFRKAALK
jgi:hypothetical protein